MSRSHGRVNELADLHVLDKIQSVGKLKYHGLGDGVALSGLEGS